MVRPCAVPGCPSSSSDPTQVAHRFPKRAALAQRWQQCLQLQHVPLPVLMHKYVVCTRHFDRSAYRNAQSKHLNVTALPRAVDGGSVVYIPIPAPVSDTDNAIDMDEQQTLIGDERLSITELTAAASARIGAYTDEELPDDCSIVEDDTNSLQLATGADDNLFYSDEQFAAEEQISGTAADEEGPTVYLMQTDDEDVVEYEQDSVQPVQPAPDVPATAETSEHPLQSVLDETDNALMPSPQHRQEHHQFDNMIELPEQLLDGAALHVNDNDGSDPHQFVYVIDMRSGLDAELQQPPAQLIHIECADNQLPEQLLDTQDCGADDAVLQPAPTQTPADATPPGAHVDLVDQSSATINSLLSALTEPTPNNSAINTDGTDDEEPYALHDTVEVRLYNQMSKRSLIQLLVAANGRIRDLEQRVASMEAVHARVLGSLDMVRSVLKR